MLESLPLSLAIVALVSCVLAGYAWYDKRHPSPIAPESGNAGPQGVSVFALACVILSASVPFICFAIMGSRYPVFDYMDATVGGDPSLFVTIAAYLATCIAVGFYEEGIFRVILQGLFERGFAANGAQHARCGLYAAVLASMLFAGLHIASPLPSDVDTVQIVLQAALKFTQGAFFGLSMAGLLKKTGSFALIVAIHSCYDLLFFFPWIMVSGDFPATYLTGLPIDTFALGANCFCLLPVVVVSIREFMCGGAMQHGIR